jgi:amino acid adenylation domain-containing protein/non-ribosomal peptide synthase protein (TIGR01720 family)
MIVEELFHLCIGRDRAPAPQSSPPFDDQSWLRQRDFQADKAFWQNALCDFPGPSLLHHHHSGAGPASDAAAFRSVCAQLTVEENADFKAMVCDRSTGAAVLQAAWALFLARYCGESDVWFGHLRSGLRPPIKEAGQAVGCFFNILPVHLRVDSQMNVGGLMEQASDWCRQTREHEFLPYPQIRQLSPMESNPLTAGSLVLYNDPPLHHALAYQDETTCWHDFVLYERPTTPLILKAWGGEPISLELQYDPAVFSAETAACMMEHFRTLLGHFVRDGYTALCDVAMLSRSEHLRITQTWNDTKAAFPETKLIHQWFEDQVAKRPAATAVRSTSERWTYAQLNQRADEVAALIKSVSCAPGELIAVLMHRSPAAIALLMGILKAGAAYVPIDPAWPRKRIQQLLTTVDPVAVLTDGDSPDVLGQCRSIRFTIDAAKTLTPVDDGGISLTYSSGSRSRKDSLKDEGGNLAYVIFTSGSTGQPKGVAVTHRAVSNLIDWVNRRWNLGPQDQLLFVTSFCFDLSVYDIFGILAAGGTIRIADELELSNPHTLVDMLTQEPISFWDSAPAALERLLPVLERQDLQKAQLSLRLIFLSGDWIALNLPTRLRRLSPQATLVALGGATEATVWSNYFSVDQLDAAWRSIPYGRPIQNARYYILAPDGSVSPVGAEGDLVIAGECLARGYYRQPELTRQCFVPQEGLLAETERIYRTGDRARFFPDGNIEFLGRKDHQVKLRGYRIELAEIDAVLASHGQVASSATIVHKRANGASSIVCCVVPTGADVPSREQLLDFLRSELPSFMVPSSVQLMGHLPLSANGKVDRAALHAVVNHAVASQVSQGLPANAYEAGLLRVWRRTLQNESIGVNDSFFEFGGDSLAAIDLICQAESAGCGFSLADLVQWPTVCEMARYLARAPVASPASKPIAEQDAPCTPIQHWFFDRRFSHPERYSHAFFLHATDALNIDALQKAAAWVLGHHAGLRLYFPPDKPLHQRLAPPPIGVDLPTIDLRHVAADNLKSELLSLSQDLRRQISLSSPPLLKIAHFRTSSPSGDLIVFIFHHLIIDGVSTKIVTQDLDTAYRALLAGTLPKLPHNQVSYLDWARSLAEKARDRALADELAQFHDLPWSEVHSLPRDDPAGRNSYQDCHEHSVGLDSKQTNQLRRVSQLGTAYSAANVLLAGLAYTLAHWTRSNVVLIDDTGHGRDPIAGVPSVVRTVGYLSSISPLLIDVGEVPLGKQLVISTDRQRRSMPLAGVKYGVLRYHSPASEVRSRIQSIPQAQLKFNFQGNFDSPSDAGRFRPFAISLPGVMDPLDQRTYLINIDCAIQDDQLKVTWRFSKTIHDPCTITDLAARHLNSITKLVTSIA